MERSSFFGIMAFKIRTKNKNEKGPKKYDLNAASCFNLLKCFYLCNYSNLQFRFNERA